MVATVLSLAADNGICPSAISTGASLCRYLLVQGVG